MTHRFSYIRLSALLCAGALAFAGAHAHAQGSAKTPSLIITSDPLPESLRQKIYGKPVKVREIMPTELIGKQYYSPTETLVSQTVRD